MAIVLGTVVALTVRDALVTQSALRAARDHVASARTAVLAGEVGEARTELAAAERAVRRAHEHSDGPMWSLAGRMPVLGRSVRIVQGTVRVAATGVEVGVAGVEGDAGTLPTWSFRNDDGRVDLDQVQRIGDAIRALPVDRLRAAREELASIGGWVPDPVGDAQDDALELADRTLDEVEQATALTSLLPGLLGGEGRRTYFLAMQNSAELRGTGGLIGFHAMLTVADGGLILSEVRSEEELEVDPGTVPASEAFERRYGDVLASSLLNNTNVDPDLPTTAPVLMALVEEVRGVDLDGVIALDPVGLAMILRGTGPMDLPPGMPARVPDPLPIDLLPEVTMVEAYEVFGGPTDERKAFHRALAEQSFERLLGAEWDVSMARRVADAITGRHLQFHSAHPQEQQVLEDLGAGGAMAARSDGDLLAVTANNAAGNKQDVHVQHAVSGEITLSGLAPDTTAPQPTASRDATLRVTLDNPLPDEGRDLYIIGSAPRGGRGLDGPPGLNRTWFTVWSPASTEAVAARDGQGGPLGVSRGTIHGHAALDHYLETPSESTAAFEVDLRGPVDLRHDGAAMVYDLTLWHQAKAIPDDLDLTVTVPRGFRVVDAVVEGGGAAPLPPMAEESHTDVAVRTGATSVHVTGTAWRDVHLTLRMRPG